MKLECVQQKLLDAVLIAEKTTSKNATLPVLGCLFLEATGNKLSIKATNLDLGIDVSIPAKVTKEGVVAVPGSIFHNVIAANRRSTKITLEVTKGNMLVTTDHGHSVIKAVPHEDFPSLPQIENGTAFDVATNVLKEGLQSVWFSASQSTIKPELASVYIYQKDKKLYFVATDSFRLSEKILVGKKLPEFDPILIPIRNVSEIIKTLDFIGGDTAVTVSLNENQLSLTHEGVYLTSRLIDGTFPDYRQIIPKEHTTELTLLKQDFVDALKKTHIFSDKFNQIHFSLEDRIFTLSAQNADTGETTEQIQASVTGDDLEINFNHKYLTDTLTVLQGESITLNLNGLGKPLVIRSVSDNSFLYLVMPMNR